MKIGRLRRIADSRLIAIIRATAADRLVHAAGALIEGGVPIMEVTANTPGAFRAIEAISRAHGRNVLVGVGSVLDPESCHAAIQAGAEFVVTPVVRIDVIRTCHRYGVPIICGAFTPTEALTACEEGADLVKIFPAEQFGPGYLRALRAPMPQLSFVPTGGITPENAADYLAAGAVALGIGSRLVNDTLLQNGDWPQLITSAKAYRRAVDEA